MSADDLLRHVQSFFQESYSPFRENLDLLRSGWGLSGNDLVCRLNEWQAKGFLTWRQEVEGAEDFIVITPPPSSRHSASVANGVPFMITAAMKQALRDRGYTNEEVREMLPDEAHQILDSPPSAPDSTARKQGNRQPAAKPSKSKSPDPNTLHRKNGLGAVREEHDAAKPVEPPPKPPPSDASAPEKKRERRLNIGRLSEVMPTTVKWLWPDRIPRKFVLFTGPPDVGKTTAVIDIAARVTTGRAWPDGSSTASLGSAVIVTAEDGISDTIRTRAEAAGANLDRFHYLKSVVERDGRPGVFSLQEDLARLREVTGRIGDVAVVIFDPVTAYLGAGKLDTHKTADVRAVLSPLTEFADAQNLTVLGLTHPPKSVGGNAINAATGSLAFIAAARAAYLFSRDEEGGRTLMLPIKNNLGPRKDGLAFRVHQRNISTGIVASHLVWDHEPVTVTANEVLAAAESGRATGDRSALNEAMDFIRTELLRGEVEATIVQEQARKAGISIATFRRARDELKRLEGLKNRREGFGRDGKFYLSLPIDAHEKP